MTAVSSLMSMRRYAAHRKALGLRGGSLTAVQKAVKSGKIQLVEVGGEKLVNQPEADASWSVKTDPTQGRPLADNPRAVGQRRLSPPDAPQPPSAVAEPLDLVQERARLAKAQADKHELDNAERAGLLINRDLAMHVFSSQIAAAKNRLVGMGAKLAFELCGALGLPADRAVDVEELVDREVREILEELSADAAESEIR